jgi:protein TonB
MPRDLFGDVTRPSVSIGSRKWYTVPISLLSHSTIVALVVIVPLMATDMVPKPWQPMEEFIIIDSVKPPPPPPPIREVRPEIAPAVPEAAPVVAPEGFTPERQAPDPSWQDDNPGVVNIVDPGASVVALPPPPPAPQQPVRVGGAIRPPQRIRDAQPAYPPLAMAARVQGIVIIEATIGADGRITDTRVLRSIPLLDQAAVDAVRQWQYTPTQLNGVPVPVIMTVTVTFTLK